MTPLLSLVSWLGLFLPFLTANRLKHFLLIHRYSDAGTGGARGLLAPQYFADQLTPFQPGRADYPQLLLLAPPMFFTFRHHCVGVNSVL